MPSETWNPAADAWFAGFTDGEGCFVISRDKERRLHQPQFRLGLRVDDMAVLERLAEAFGGRIRINTRLGPSHPSAHWRVTKKSDLARLVDYYDRFPLRAKKQRDYAVWRKAVKILLAQSSRAPELVALHVALQATRAYEQPTDVVIPTTDESTQLRLVS